MPEAEDASEETDPDNAKSGPYRRVLSETGYRKAQMKVRLPTYLGVDRYPKTYQDESGFPLVRHKYGEDGKPVLTGWASSDDVPYVYLGITPTVPGLSDVEGGLRFHRVRESESEWKVYMVGRPRAEVDPETGKRKLGPPRSWQTAPNIDSTFRVARSDYEAGPVSLTLSLGKPGVEMAYLVVEQTGIAQGSTTAVSVPTWKLKADGSNVMFRRVVSIAQTFREAYGTEYPDHPDRLQGYVLSDGSGSFSKVDLSKHNYGTSAAIFDCRLWTPASQALSWDHTRLHATKGLRWFPKGPGLDHVVTFSRKDQGQQGVLDYETVTIELRP